jgi:uncharacterized protein YbjT (DUF2867 family)
MITVTGATGKVGGTLARTLLTGHIPVRVVVRDAAKGAPWSAQGAEVAIADSNDTTALTAAFTGARGAFVMLPPNFDPSPGFPEARAMIEALQTALRRAQPPKVVVLSTIGADAVQPNLLNQLGMLERAFASLPMPIAFLRAAWFMDNAVWSVAPARADGVVPSHLQPLNKVFPMVAAEDVGRTAAELLLEDWSSHRVVELEGQQRVSPNDIVAAFAKALGKPVSARAVPRAQWEAEFRTQGMTNPTPRMQMLDGFNEGWIDFPDHGATARKGTVTIDQAIARLVAENS